MFENDSTYIELYLSGGSETIPAKVNKSSLNKKCIIDC